MITVEEFQKKYCSWCGSQRCLGDKESIEYCGYLNKDPIEGLEYKGIAYRVNVNPYDTAMTIEDVLYETTKEGSVCDMNYYLNQMINYQPLNKS